MEPSKIKGSGDLKVGKIPTKGDIYSDKGGKNSDERWEKFRGVWIIPIKSEKRIVKFTFRACFWPYILKSDIYSYKNI